MTPDNKGWTLAQRLAIICATAEISHAMGERPVGPAVDVAMLKKVMAVSAEHDKCCEHDA